jgi:hypothetical protein
MLVPVHAPTARAAGPPGLETTPLDMVIATDESGSLSPDDVRREIDATSTIAQGGLNPRSRVTVLGFGSDNGPGQQAVHEYCRPTVLGGAVEMQHIAECVRGLHRRTPREGNDTDHVAALSQALHTFESASPQPWIDQQWTAAFVRGLREQRRCLFVVRLDQTPLPTADWWTFESRSSRSAREAGPP